MQPKVPLSESIEDALRVARALAREHSHERYSAAHLLRALLQPDSPGATLLLALHKEVPYLRDWADVRLEDMPRVSPPPADMTGDDALARVLEEADTIRQRLGLDQVHPVCVLAALTKPNVGFSPQQLRSLPLQERDLLAQFLKEPASVTSSDTEALPMPPLGQPAQSAGILGGLCAPTAVIKPTRPAGGSLTLLSDVSGSCA